MASPQVVWDILRNADSNMVRKDGELEVISLRPEHNTSPSPFSCALQA
jgi:hypothetical protein